MALVGLKVADIETKSGNGKLLKTCWNKFLMCWKKQLTPAQRQDMGRRQETSMEKYCDANGLAVSAVLSGIHLEIFYDGLKVTTF